MANSFITVINCIDGRVQEPILKFSRKKFKADFVDTVTIPGPDKVLSQDKPVDKIRLVKDCTLLSLDKHKSKVVLIVGHYDCAANPVDKKTHILQLKQAQSRIKGWLGKRETLVYGVWIGKDWKAVLIA
jgi:hypothetical protein